MRTRDFHGLFTFQIVVREGGFSAAARHLSVTPGAVSRTMAQLESTVGVRLFNRTTVEFSLTAEGQHLANLVCDKLVALDDAMADFKVESEAPSGLLRVSLTNSYGENYVIPRLSDFFARYPDIKLNIAFNDNRQSLIEDGFDVGTCYGTPDESAYVSRIVCEPRLVLVGAPAYLAMYGVPKSPEELLEHFCINTIIGNKGPAAWMFQRRNAMAGELPILVQPNDRLLLSDQIDGVVPAAIAGLGLTVAHVRAVLPHMQSGTLKALLTDYQIDAKFGARTVRVFFPHRSKIAQRVRAFVDFLAEDLSDEAIDCSRYAID